MSGNDDCLTDPWGLGLRVRWMEGIELDWFGEGWRGFRSRFRFPRVDRVSCLCYALLLLLLLIKI